MGASVQSPSLFRMDGVKEGPFSSQFHTGKSLGRTKLTDISPKKTVEGAVGGLASSVAVAVALWSLTHWPATPLAAAGFGVGASASARITAAPSV